MAEVLWYYAKNDQQVGPVSPAELKQLATSRTLSPDDLIWREGMDGWAPAAKVKGLFADVREPVIAAPSVNNSPTETMPPASAAILGAVDATPPPAPPSSGIQADVFSPSLLTPPPEPRVVVRPIERESEAATGGWEMVDLLWLGQMLLWGICIAVVFVGGLLFARALGEAVSAIDRAAAAGIFSTFFIGAYVVARAGERVAALVQAYFERRRNS